MRTRHPAADRRAGLSLIEIVVTVGLTALLLCALCGMVQHAVRHHRRLAADLARTYQASLALDRVKAAVRHAREVVPPGPDGSRADRLVLLLDGGARMECFGLDGRLVLRTVHPANPVEGLLLEAPARVAFRFEDTPWAPCGFVEIELEIQRDPRPALHLVSAAAVRSRK